MNAAFGTTLISHEDFVAGLVLLRALTLENMINAIDTGHDGHRNKIFPNLLNGCFRSLEHVGQMLVDRAKSRQAGEIPGALDQGQRSAGARACTVTVAPQHTKSTVGKALPLLQTLASLRRPRRICPSARDAPRDP